MTTSVSRGCALGILISTLTLAVSACGSTTTPKKIATKVSVTCSRNSIELLEAAACTATVSDTGGPRATPVGVVHFSTNAGGSFDPASDCPLTSHGPSAQCRVTYEASGHTGTVELTASYLGDGIHSPSHVVKELDVTPIIDPPL